MKAKGNNIKLFINEATVDSICFGLNYNSKLYMNVGVELKINGKRLTSMSLTSDSDDDSPRHIPLTPKMEKLYEEIQEEIKKIAVISLERIQNIIE